jgi:hypothetical protein
MKRILAAIAAVVLALGVAGTVSATPPPSHKVTICHAAPPDTAENGWVAINVDIASTGYMQSGHQDQHDADIIPAYDYPGFVYTGKNLDTYFYGVLGSDILDNGCAAPQSSPDPSVPPCDECGAPGDTPEPTMPNTAMMDPVAATPPASATLLALFFGGLAGSLMILRRKDSR